MSLADALIPQTTTKVESYASELPPDPSDVQMNTAPHSEHDGEDDKVAQDADEDMQDLFGEDAAAEDNRPDDSTGHSDQGDDGISESERRYRKALEYAEDDEPEPVIDQVLEANAAIPSIPLPRSSDGKHWVLRMPNFVKVDSKPFHPDTYVGPEQEDEELTAESLREKSMSIKLKVENTVRWRWVKDQQGQDQRQSNARVIRWSDGTLSLKLGKELFDITQTVDTSGAVQRSALGGLSQSQSSQTLNSSTPQKPIQGQGLTYLVAQHKRAGILQCEALITGYMSLRPTGMQSETHRMLVRAVGQKHNKVARLRMAPDPTMDPEREKMELLKMASKKTRRPRAAGGEDDGFGGGGGGGARRRRQSYTRKRRSDDMWSDDEDEDVFGAGGSDDEFGTGGGGGDDRRKRRKAGDDANPRKGPGEYQTDDFLVSDSEEDGDHDESDEGGKSSSKHRRRRKGGKHRDSGAAADDDEEDDLEKLDAKIDLLAAEERKRRQGKPGTGEEGEAVVATGVASQAGASAAAARDAEDAMDVESEDEEDVAVRRGNTTAGNRKKRAIDVEEEDDE